MSEGKAKSATATNDKLAEIPALQSRLAELRNLFELVAKNDAEELLQTTLSRREGAKLLTSITFALTTLYFVALNAHGKDLLQHPVVRDIERIKAMVKKIQEIETVEKSNFLPTAKRLRVDSTAAYRIVMHHVDK
jgi:hypothetical protein